MDRVGKLEINKPIKSVNAFEKTNNENEADQNFNLEFSKQSIIFVSQSDRWTNAIALGVYQYLKNPQENIQICDMSNFEIIIPNWIRNRLQMYLLKRRHDFPTKVFQAFCVANKIKLVDIGASNQKKEYGSLDDEIQIFYSRFLKDPEGAMDWNEYNNTLGPALLSIWVTTIALDDNAKPEKYQAEIYEQIHLFIEIFHNTIKVLEQNPEIKSGYVFNGRLPITAAIVAAMKEKQIQVFYYEYAESSKRIYLESYRPHNRIETQKNVKEVVGDLSPYERTEAATRYLESRKNDTSVNVFLNLKNRSKKRYKKNENEKLAVIFTSSPDEMVGIGEEWEWKGMNGQLEAIGLATKRLLEVGYTPIIRIHPNLVNKSWGMYRREIKSLHQMCSNIVLPGDGTNSYELMEMADIVVTCGSTIGLEAVALKIPTYQLGHSSYDLLTDVRKLLSQKDIIDCDFKTYPVEEKETVNAVIALERANTRITAQEWTSEFLELTQEFHKQSLRINKILKFIFAVPTMPILLCKSPRYASMVVTNLLGNKFSSKLFQVFHRL